MTDYQILKLCRHYGGQARLARQKFAGLLPEVFKRKLYKKNCSSIYEFAAKLAGMSREQVDIVLRLEKKFEDKPVLKDALTKGEISSNKLVRIASIATPENQEELAEVAKTMSNRAIETFVRDEKSLHVHAEPQESLLDVNLLEHLSPALQKNLIERHKKGININKLLIDLLHKHDQEIENELNEIGEQTQPTKSKYIKVKTQKLLHKKHGTKCAMPNCNKDTDQIHHALYGSDHKIHDPRYMIPLCRGHHEVTHTKDIIFQKMRQKVVL